MGADGAGYYAGGKLITEPCVPVQRLVNTVGTGDLLSVCLMLLHPQAGLHVKEKLHLANQVVAEFIEGRRECTASL
jgi:hypothetical protein